MATLEEDLYGPSPPSGLEADLYGGAAPSDVDEESWLAREGRLTFGIGGDADLRSSVIGRAMEGMARPAAGIAQLVTGGNPAVTEAIQRRRGQAESALAPDEMNVAGYIGEALSPTTMIPLSRLAPAASYLGRVGQGIAGGAATSIVSPYENTDNLASQAAEKALIGGALGGAFSGIVAPAVTYGVKGAGKLVDMVRGRGGEVNAGKLMRDVAGPKLEAIKRALEAAPDDVTAAQAAFGVDRDEWMALGELARRGDPTAYRLIAKVQNAKSRGTIEQLASGGNQEAAIMARRLAKKELQENIWPKMQTELNAANEAGRQLPRLQGQADAFGEMAAENVDDVRRFTAAGERATARANDTYPVAGIPRIPGRYTYMDELAQRAERVAQTGADDSLITGEASRFAQSRADSLAAHGLKPLDTQNIVGKLSAKLDDPTIAGDRDTARVINRVANDIQNWTDKNGGVIDADALFAIRKNSVNSAINQMMKGEDQKAKQKFAASVLSRVKPHIDDAIESAGGSDWRSALEQWASGESAINRQKMGAKALELFDKSPTGFVDLAEGNAPKVVEKVFGPGKVSLDTEMGNLAEPIKRAAAEISRDEAIQKQAVGASESLYNIVNKDSLKFRLPALFNRAATVTNKTLDAVEDKINQETMRAVTEGMKSGKNAMKVILSLPASERNKVARALMMAPETRAWLIGESVIAGQTAANAE